jgi:hypothetical protein
MCTGGWCASDRDKDDSGRGTLVTAAMQSSASGCLITWFVRGCWVPDGDRGSKCPVHRRRSTVAEVPLSKWIVCMSCAQHAHVRCSAACNCMIAQSRHQPVLRPVPNDWVELQRSPQYVSRDKHAGRRGCRRSTPGTCPSGCRQLHASYMRATASSVGVFPHLCGG